MEDSMVVCKVFGEASSGHTRAAPNAVIAQSDSDDSFDGLGFSDTSFITINRPRAAPTFPKPVKTIVVKDEHYTYSQSLGMGAQGAVHLYISTGGKKVAVKYFPSVEEEKDRQKLQSEINFLMQLNSAHIVEYIDRQFSSTHTFIVMEHLPVSLRDVLKNGALPLRRCAKYANHVLLALQMLHGQNIVHQDIKPENLLLDEKDNVKLADFGISVRRGAQIFPICGTPFYLPPDLLLLGGDVPRFQQDIWSFGVTFLELAHGSLPPYYADCKNEADRVTLIKQANYEKLLRGCNIRDELFCSFLQRCLVPIWHSRALSLELFCHQFLINPEA